MGCVWLYMQKVGNIPGKFPTLLWLFRTSKFQLKATAYVLVFTTNLQIHIVTCCIHLHIHHTSRTPYLFHSFSDFVVYVVTTLIFPKNQRQCASFSINVAILFLSFKRATARDWHYLFATPTYFIQT